MSDIDEVGAELDKAYRQLGFFRGLMIGIPISLLLWAIILIGMLVWISD